MRPSIITFTTDFGYADAYAASMKGVALGINPGAILVDVSHEIDREDILHGAFVLAAASSHFPDGAIHVAVVDPGVGTDRRALAVWTGRQTFVLPDNGLLSFLLPNSDASPSISEAGQFLAPAQTPVPPGWSAVCLTNDAYWRTPVSATFHGRDIFAPVAAHISAGVALERLGVPVDALTCLTIPVPKWEGNRMDGNVVRVDRFGNLVSTIPNDAVSQCVRVEIAGASMSGLSQHFQAGAGLLALRGSGGYVEIALSGGSAADALCCGVGEVVRAFR